MHHRFRSFIVVMALIAGAWLLALYGELTWGVTFTIALMCVGALLYMIVTEE